MKRTKLLIAVLLILAASLILTGCPREPEEEIDPAADAGTWKAVTFSDSLDKKPTYTWSSNPDEIKRPNYFSKNPSSQIIQYEFTSSDRLAANSNGHDLYAVADDWDETWYSLSDCKAFEPNCMGFEVTIQKVSGNPHTYFGVDFNEGKTTAGVPAYFRLLFQRFTANDQSEHWGLNLSYYVWNGNKYVKSGDSLAYYADSMNPVGQSNKIKVRTRNDGQLELLINDNSVMVFGIPESAPRSGRIWVVGGLSFEDTVIANNPDPVKITWKFDKIQQQQ